MNNNEPIPRPDSTFAALVLIRLAYKKGLIERLTYLNTMEKYGKNMDGKMVTDKKNIYSL